MRAIRISARAVNGSRPAGRGRGSPPSRRRPGARPVREKGRSVPVARLRGLRWVPAPLALLAAMLGVLVMGSMQGRAAADLAKEPSQADGLSLTVDTMGWMSNDMQGNGAPQAAPAPADSPGGYTMPDSMMPGMQPTGDNRLRVEVDLSNVTGSVQQYSTTDFSLSGPGGKTWKVNGQEHSAQPASADLQPGFRTTVDVYFDIPTSNSKNLTLHWSRGGRTISMPVNTGGKEPGTMHM
jgi:hypothetical protein